MFFINRSTISPSNTNASTCLGYVCLFAVSHVIHMIVKRIVEERRQQFLVSTDISDNFRNRNTTRINVMSRYDAMVHTFSNRLQSWSKHLYDKPRQLGLTLDKKKSVYSTDSESEEYSDSDYDYCASWNTVYSASESRDFNRELIKDYEYEYCMKSSVPLGVIPAKVVETSSDRDWEDDFSNISRNEIFEEDFYDISHGGISVFISDTLDNRLKDAHESSSDIIIKRGYQEWN